MKSLLLKLGFGIALLLLARGAAFACLCPPVPPDQTEEQAKAAFLEEVKNAAVIFSGEVIESDLLQAKFKVDKVWIGNAGDEVIIRTGVKMYEDGAYTRSSCDYGGYRVGRKYVVWASGPATELKAHACSRTKLTEDAGRDIEMLDALKAEGNELPGGEPRPRSSPPGRGEI